MNAAGNLLLALLILWGTGKAAQEAMRKLEGMAKSRIQKGLPKLTPFTTALTGLRYSNDGELVTVHSVKNKTRNPTPKASK